MPHLARASERPQFIHRKCIVHVGLISERKHLPDLFSQLNRFFLRHDARPVLPICLALGIKHATACSWRHQQGCNEQRHSARRCRAAMPPGPTLLQPHGAHSRRVHRRAARRRSLLCLARKTVSQSRSICQSSTVIISSVIIRQSDVKITRRPARSRCMPPLDLLDDRFHLSFSHACCPR